MMVSPGDFDGDGNIDLITRRSDGKLFMYRGNGSGGWLNGGNTQIGTGWGSMTWIHSPGDFSGDGNSDLIARKSDGTSGYIGGTDQAGGSVARIRRSGPTGTR